MGNCSSQLRRHMRDGDAAGVQRVVEAAGEGSPDLINEDFTVDCLLDSCQQNIRTPLHTALMHRQMDILEILLKYGGDPNTPSRHFGHTILHQAARQNNLAAATMAVKYGADVHAADNVGKLPIHDAAGCLWEHRNIDALRYLVEEVGRPEDIHIKDDSGDTPLHAAVRRDYLKAVEYLIERGADMKATNGDGKTPMDLARSEFRDKLIKFENT